MGIRSGNGAATRRLAVLAVIVGCWGNAHATSVNWQVVSTFPQGAFTSPYLIENKTPASNIVPTSDGRIFGLDTTGSSLGGAVYSISPAGEFNELYTLGLYDGAADGAPARSTPGIMPTLGMLANGDLYGVTASGGPFTDPQYGPQPFGTVFTYSPTTGVYSILHTFYGGGGASLDGSYPIGIWPASEAGSYFGLTMDGVLFKLDAAGNESFVDISCLGRAPNAMILASDGTFYGSRPFTYTPPDCVSGGTSNTSAIFKITPDGQVTGLHVGEQYVNDAANQFVEAPDGTIYGTTLYGGDYNSGVVFKIATDGTYSVLHAFDPATDGFDASALVVGSDGNIYGSTSAGPNGAIGLVYRLSPSGVMTVLHRFTDWLSGPLVQLVQVPQPGPITLLGVAGGGNSANAPSQLIKMVMTVRDDFFGNGSASALTFANGAFSSLKAGMSSLDVQAGGAIAAGYYPVAVADFNGDGHADTLWTSAANDLYVWLGSAGGFTSRSVGSYPAGWKVVGSGDVNGDGKDDLIWMDEQTHQFGYWLMDGAKRIGSRIINVASGYHPVAFGDFNGDGKLDVVWTSASRDVYFWLGNGTGFTSKYVTNYVAGWQISGHGDLDGDGNDDLVWSKTDGSQWGYWLMSGATLRHVQVLSGTAGVGYSIAGVADYEGRGVVDILWSDGQHVVLGHNGGCSTQGICDFSAFGTAASLPSGQSVFNNSVSH